MTKTEIKARIEALEKIVSTPITNGMMYALELARLRAKLAEMEGAK